MDFSHASNYSRLWLRKAEQNTAKKTAEKCVVRNDEMQFSTLVMF